MSSPTPEGQLVFLSKIQKLFSEGDFAATYKYALLMALTELAIEHGNESGESLALRHAAIATKFIELYWQQAAPYRNGQAEVMADVLAQNHGPQAAVIKAIVDFRRAHQVTTMQSAARSRGYAKLVAKVAQTVSAQPINYLQNVGGATDPFLYEKRRGGIELKPGVACCLQRFQSLVFQLARSHWVDHIKHNRQNMPILGHADDLEAFLFKTPRESLAIIGAGLRKLSNGYCFYCDTKVQDADVDHFIPFSLYPRDLMHNFVLAHPACNRSKSDTLAARPHLERWLERASRYTDDLAEIGESAGRAVDLAGSRRIAQWGYGNAFSSEAHAWIKAKTYEPVDRGYLDCLS